MRKIGSLLTYIFCYSLIPNVISGWLNGYRKKTKKFLHAFLIQDVPIDTNGKTIFELDAGFGNRTAILTKLNFNVVCVAKSEFHAAVLKHRFSHHKAVIIHPLTINRIQEPEKLLTEMITTYGWPYYVRINRNLPFEKIIKGLNEVPFFISVKLQIPKNRQSFTQCIPHLRYLNITTLFNYAVKNVKRSKNWQSKEEIIDRINEDEHPKLEIFCRLR